MSDLIALVTDVERDVNELGWDYPALAFVLTESEEKGLHFQLLNLPLALYSDIGDCMQALANRGMRLGDAALGLMIVCEAWGLSLPPDVISEDGTYVGPSPSESPDRIECRMVTLLTRDGRMINAQRERVADTFEIVEADAEYIGMQMKARIPYYMHVLLTGEEPDE